jgi:hypothetical protein
MSLSGIEKPLSFAGTCECEFLLPVKVAVAQYKNLYTL